MHASHLCNCDLYSAWLVGFVLNQAGGAVQVSCRSQSPIDVLFVLSLAG
jgi:hypothetical protein